MTSIVDISRRAYNWRRELLHFQYSLEFNILLPEIVQMIKSLIYRLECESFFIASGLYTKIVVTYCDDDVSHYVNDCIIGILLAGDIWEFDRYEKTYDELIDYLNYWVNQRLLN